MNLYGESPQRDDNADEVRPAHYGQTKPRPPILERLSSLEERLEQQEQRFAKELEDLRHQLGRLQSLIGA